MHNTRSSLLLMLFLAGGCATSQSAPIPMHELTKDKTTELTNGNEFLVIQSSAEFAKALTRKLSHVSAQKPEDVLKAVDFKTETVVGVMLSNRGSSCTGVDITSITQDGNGSVVHYREHEPAPGDVCLDTVYSPFHFVAIAKTNAPVKFEKDKMP
jgi:hypothetical protein